jgi:hypothetical protein
MMCPDLIWRRSSPINELRLVDSGLCLSYPIQLMDTDATRAIAAFMRAMEEAQAMGQAGNAGTEFDDVLLHARELLNIVDDELLSLDRSKYADVFEATSTLRGKLERLRDELRGGGAH